MPKISIIMPLYNASKYLEETLRSILQQTLEDFELICINDASTDDTVQIIRNFQTKDGRIHIFSNAERHGAAYSRNRGMKEAKGEYFAFLDGDDIFDEEMLEKAYQAAEEKCADIVTYQYLHVSSDVIHHKFDRVHSEEYKARYCRQTFSLSEYAPGELIQFPLGPCDKLYRRSLIEDNHLAFQNLTSGNDLYFVFMALLLSKRTVMLEEDRVMLYARDHFRQGRISLNRDPMCTYQAFMKAGQDLRDRNMFACVSHHFYYRVFYSLRDALLADKDRERAKRFYGFLQEEGIEHFRAIDRQCFDELDEYIRNGFRHYIEKDFTSGWYREENILKLFLHQNAERVIALFERYRFPDQKIAVWGAGENGKVLLEFCRQHHLDISVVIDKSRDKQGTELAGCKVAALHEVADDIQIIIISARFIYDDVVREVGNREIEVLDINRFLCID
ncbi:MAG: glycosyltransferase [Lachnospiraceae bacterium]|nr:glycosyltransferase [Lachnospiraceae bacterium]